MTDRLTGNVSSSWKERILSLETQLTVIRLIISAVILCLARKEKVIARPIKNRPLTAARNLFSFHGAAWWAAKREEIYSRSSMDGSKRALLFSRAIILSISRTDIKNLLDG